MVNTYASVLRLPSVLRFLIHSYHNTDRVKCQTNFYNKYRHCLVFGASMPLIAKIGQLNFGPKHGTIISKFFTTFKRRSIFYGIDRTNDLAPGAQSRSGGERAETVKKRKLFRPAQNTGQYSLLGRMRRKREKSLQCLHRLAQPGRPRVPLLLPQPAVSLQARSGPDVRTAGRQEL